MLTWTDQQLLYQQLTGDTSLTGLVVAKRDMNEGAAQFLNRLGRKFNKEYLAANLVANQQYYQFPSEVLRISEARFLNATSGNYYYEPELVTDELFWNQLNNYATTSSYPTHYYIRGFNELGVYPTPSTAIVNGVTVSYEPQHIDLTQDDLTNGSVTVTNGSVTVTHSATGFTQQMIGSFLQVTDGTDGKWYRISAFTSTSSVNIENYYEGISGSGRTFRIGQIMKIPNGYQDAPVLFAASRFYQSQNDQRTAPIFDQRFEARIKSAKETYARSTSRMGVKSRNSGRNAGNSPFTDLTRPIQYP